MFLKNVTFKFEKNLDKIYFQENFEGEWLSLKQQHLKDN